MPDSSPSPPDAVFAATLAELGDARLRIGVLTEQLAAAERLKAEFVATMSHELRTPLHVVLGFGSLLVDEAFGPLTADQQMACQKIVESTERLAGLIDELLDLSRLQARTLALCLQPTAVEAFVRDAVDALAPLAGRKGLAIAVEIPEGLPLVRGDGKRLGQVFRHLLENAVKFTPTGGALGVRARAEAGGVVVEVWDTGIGIPESARNRLFERFFQVDGSSTRVHGGAGIGLALVKELVECHGGRVEVESAEGTGSTFFVYLPTDLRG